MTKTMTVVIGAARPAWPLSRRLTERSIDRIVLERGEVALPSPAARLAGK